jgi:hypothetical protein
MQHAGAEQPSIASREALRTNPRATSVCFVNFSSRSACVAYERRILQALLGSTQRWLLLAEDIVAGLAAVATTVGRGACAAGLATCTRTTGLFFGSVAGPTAGACATTDTGACAARWTGPATAPLLTDA